MNQDRTSTITNSQLKEGYKQTEVGVIPEDWAVKPLGSISDVIMGQSPPGNTYNKSGTGMPLINGPTEFTQKYPVKAQWTTQSTKICRKDDLLLCVRGSSTGRINISNDEYCIGRGVAAIRALSISNTVFLTYQVNSGIERLLALSTGSTFANVDSKSIRSIEIPLPPTKAEQEAIACTLSDIDELIESLDRLLTKKRQIKQGAMQELLRSKDEWVENKLGNLFNISAGCDLRKNEFSSEQDENHQFPIYSNAITDYGLYGYCATKDYAGNCITITARGSTGHAVFRSNDFTAIGRLLILEPISNINCLFVAEYINLWIDFANESTGVPQLTVPQASKYVIQLPEINEQIEIANILSDMDAEIDSISAKLTKTRQLKQGMMHELLTGRIRLLVES